MKATDSPAVTQDSPPYSNPGGDTGVGPDRQSMPRTPRWVKVFGVIALVAVVVVAIMLLGGGGEHGPGRHAPSGGAGGQAPPSNAATQGPAPSGDAGGSGGAGGHTPPAGGHTP